MSIRPSLPSGAKIAARSSALKPSTARSNALEVGIDGQQFHVPRRERHDIVVSDVPTLAAMESPVVSQFE